MGPYLIISPGMARYVSVLKSVANSDRPTIQGDILRPPRRKSSVVAVRRE